jgi:uncharacterized protein (TIGR03437 family)
VSGGGSAFTLTVTGAGFVNGATVRWNGANRTTSFVSNTQLTAQIPASDLIVPGAAGVSVFNPTPGGGASNVLSFAITPSLASVSAASFSAAAVAPESIIAAFGADLATRTLAAPTLPLPTVLAGTRVMVKDGAGAERAAPIFFVSTGQVNYLIPPGTAAGSAIATLSNENGKLSIGLLNVASVAPGHFAANANGQGVAAAVVLRTCGAAQTFEPVAQFDAATGRFVAAPIDLGSEGDQVILLLFGTGIRNRSALSAVTCQTGESAAQVSFASEAPGFVGLDQVNAGPLSRSLAGRGEVDVALTVEGKMANLVRIAIK